MCDENKVSVKILDVDGIESPRYATEGAAGADVYASDHAVIPAGGSFAVSTCVKVCIPVGYEIQVRSRSGLAFKNGIFAFPGTIDSESSSYLEVV